MSCYRALRLLAMATLTIGFASATWAQTKGSSSGRTSTAPPSQSDSRQPIMLTGNVIIDDGSALPGPVFIERTCNGRLSRDGHSDFKGYFTISINTSSQFQFGDPEGSAETGGGSGFNMIGSVRSRLPQNSSSLTAALSGCEIRASLAGFHSSSVAIPLGELGSTVGPVNVGTIVLQRMGKEQGVTVSATSLNAPKEAKKAYDKGHRELTNNKLAEARQDLEKAVQAYPRYASAWLDLGWLHTQQNQLDQARDAFTQAQSADAMFVPAFVGLASVAVRESKWAEAAEASARAAQLDGVDFPAAFYYNSLANYRLGNLEQAEKSARKGETLGVQHAFPQLSLLLGMMLAQRGEYADAAEQLRAYLKAVPTASNADKVRQQLAELETLGGTSAKADATPAAK
jgi:tetratricopeptide (TPR) repeat protein